MSGRNRFSMHAKGDAAATTILVGSVTGSPGPQLSREDRRNNGKEISWNTVSIMTELPYCYVAWPERGALEVLARDQRGEL
jgi:hypothetical protein